MNSLFHPLSFSHALGHWIAHPRELDYLGDQSYLQASSRLSPYIYKDDEYVSNGYFILQNGHDYSMETLQQSRNIFIKGFGCRRTGPPIYNVSLFINQKLSRAVSTQTSREITASYLLKIPPKSHNEHSEI